MPELAAHVGDSRFNDCMHLKEPGCAVLGAVESGEIEARRYRSYVGILESVIERQDRDR